MALFPTPTSEYAIKIPLVLLSCGVSLASLVLGVHMVYDKR